MPVRKFGELVDTERVMNNKPLKRYNVGEISLYFAPVANPYRLADTEGKECIYDARKEAFQSLLLGQLPESIKEVWYRPASAAAYRLDPSTMQYRDGSVYAQSLD